MGKSVLPTVNLVRRSRSGQRGFTLSEMLLIIVIMGIIAAMGVSRLDWVHYRLNSEVRNSVSLLAYAQRLAVSLQHNVQVIVDPAVNALVVFEDANDDGVYSVSERRRQYPFDQGVVIARNGAADLPSPSVTVEYPTYTFYRDGSADNAGVIFLTTSKAALSGNLHDSRAIEIIRATGRAFWWNNSSGSWTRGQ